MAENQPLFDYTDEQLAALDKTISTDRLQPYLILSDGDRRLAVKLYEWNIALSESFYGLLQGLEISLRNAMHRSLSEAFQREDWYDACHLENGEADAIRKAKARILNDKKIVRPCKVVAEMTFGFWISLVSPGYAQTLWDKSLHKAFVKNLGRKAAHRRLDKIRKFRNRIAHHESILARQLKDDFALILETVYWICPITAQWLKAHSTFHTRYAQKPRLKNEEAQSRNQDSKAQTK